MLLHVSQTNQSQQQKIGVVQNAKAKQKTERERKLV